MTRVGSVDVSDSSGMELRVGNSKFLGFGTSSAMASLRDSARDWCEVKFWSWQRM
jgi:hypothetical protein